MQVAPMRQAIVIKLRMLLSALHHKQSLRRVGAAEQGGLASRKACNHPLVPQKCTLSAQNSADECAALEQRCLAGRCVEIAGWRQNNARFGTPPQHMQWREHLLESSNGVQ